MRVLVLAGLLAAAASPALAQDRLLVPRVTLYPGDALAAELFVAAGAPAAASGLLRDGADLTGLVAKRTLVAGQAVPLAALQGERVIRNGHRVTLLYERDGLSISTIGQAMEHGAIGETIRVRNGQSGLVVSGRIIAPALVRVDGS